MPASPCSACPRSRDRCDTPLPTGDDLSAPDLGLGSDGMATPTRRPLRVASSGLPTRGSPGGDGQRGHRRAGHGDRATPAAGRAASRRCTRGVAGTLGQMEQYLERAVVRGGDESADARVGDVPFGERDGHVGQDVDSEPTRSAVTVKVTPLDTPCIVRVPCAVYSFVVPTAGIVPRVIGEVRTKVAVGY